MCGIFGYCGKQKVGLNDALNLLRHRGPDNLSFFSEVNTSNYIYLGHTRLSIVDLSTNANQPMISDDKNIIILFNGEIYNHNFLRKKYLGNQSFNSSSDTETILRLYQKIGLEFVNELNGDFAITLYDKRYNKITLIRDRLGVKPLYFYKNTDFFVFASEIKALIASSVAPKISEQSLNEYFIFKYVPENKTLIKDVFRLNPGHYITYDINSKKLELTQYWHLKKQDQYAGINYTEAKDHLENLLSKAIEAQLMADVPIGTFFSGGLDSSIIAHKLKDHKDLIHYTAKKSTTDLKKEGSTSDYYYAQKLANQYSLNLSPIEIGNEELNFELINRTLYYSDDLIADGSQIPSFLITREASKRTKVLLSGMGADELFYGYAGHQLSLLSTYFDSLPLLLRKLISSLLRNLKPGKGILKPYKRYLQKFGRYVDDPLRYGFFNIVGDIENSMSVYSLPGNDPLIVFKKYFDNDRDVYENITEFELNNFLIKNLTYIDRMCMANSVEGRVPFLDYNLVEFAYSLPREYKLSAFGDGKKILKDCASDFLPSYILKRRKAGFGMPLRSIFMNNAKIDSLIDYNLLNEIKYFSVDKTKQIIKNHISGIEDNSALIYSIISFQLWYNNFIKN